MLPWWVQCVLDCLTFPLNVHKQTGTSHWSVLLNLHCQVRKDLPEGFHDSGFTPSGRSLLPWLKINVNEAIIRNFLTPEITEESAARATAAH